ncbi:FtsX-like permease family protein [Natroniella sulfidigena]|uniref:ABC transporter permease n=1 Tax=Natroniella sulfidigena TaxID=723921 RepID=UPI00200B4A7E|nr:FtsX-like permease family protein [Natroniella sulfidigena]MCK8817851.1 FtsX-like permease family protein [Natroniella sulfidigena]
MKYLLVIAARNLSRHKLRTLVSIIAIALVVAIVTMARGHIVGYLEATYESYINYDTGHVKIVNQDYQGRERLLSLNYPVAGFAQEGLSKMKEELAEIDEAKYLLPRIKFGGAVNQGDEMTNVMGWGLKIDREIEAIDLDQQLKTGRMPLADSKEVIMGQRLLERLDLAVGEEVTILYNTALDSFQGSTFEIVGALETGLGLIDGNVFVLDLAQAQQMLNMSDEATELLLIGAHRNRTEELLMETKHLFEGVGSVEYSITPWDAPGNLIDYFKVGERIYNVIYIFFLLMGCVVLINTMLMIIRDRVKEIGMMSALGLKRREIWQLFLLEGMFMGVIGSLGGVLLGGAVTKVFSVRGIDYGEAMDALSDDLLIETVAYTDFSFQNLFLSFLLGVVIVTIACIFPAWRAARLDPSEALRD